MSIETPKDLSSERRALGYPSVDERAARGRAGRSAAPRSSHGEWAPSADRFDPVGVLEQEAVPRVPPLVPIRHGRMAESPFAFFRGAAGIMAADLASTPVSGIAVQLCGDAHLLNFGAFAAPDRRLVFDLNDFDETLPGPWEWDVKRLAASVAIASRERGLHDPERRRLVGSCAWAYRDAMRTFAAMSDLDIWYSRVDAEALVARLRDQGNAKLARRVDRRIGRARRKDRLRALARLTEHVDGAPRFISDPPLIVPAAELLGEYDVADGEVPEERIRGLLGDYAQTLRGEVRHLLGRYRYLDLARKVVGVGSVGTRAWMVLLTGRDAGDALFLQVKEAGPSVLEEHLEPSPFDCCGQRVVEGQRLMQAAGDVLLGWLSAVGPDGVSRDHYVRQLWDWKLSADVEGAEPGLLEPYVRLCAATLARAHARSGDAVAIASYLGGGDRFDRALEDFAEAYADQNARDHAALLDAIASGRIEARRGI